tara:strand:- start:60 stop:182 length:123 start_codon:yes stop_codon:yes gene_type:complete
VREVLLDSGAVAVGLEGRGALLMAAQQDDGVVVVIVVHVQ